MGIVYWHICIPPDESIVKSHQSTQWWHLCATLFVHSLSGHYFIICLISRSNIIVYFTGGIVLLPGLQTFWTTPIKYRSGTFTLNQCPIGSDPSAFVMWVFFHRGVYISILLDRNTWEIHHQAATDIKMQVIRICETVHLYGRCCVTMCLCRILMCFLLNYLLKLWASCQIRKIAAAHVPGMAGSFFPSPRVSDADMHHGTCVTHVPWCMPGSLTSGFLWRRWRGKTFPAFPAHAQTAILRIW